MHSNIQDWICTALAWPNGANFLEQLTAVWIRTSPPSQPRSAPASYKLPAADYTSKYYRPRTLTAAIFGSIVVMVRASILGRIKFVNCRVLTRCIPVYVKLSDPPGRFHHLQQVGAVNLRLPSLGAKRCEKLQSLSNLMFTTAVNPGSTTGTVCSLPACLL